MPELPEVETVRRGLHARLAGRRIDAVAAGGATLRKASPMPLPALAGRRVEAVRRHAKVLYWDLDDGSTFVAHLGMTGKFLFLDRSAPAQPHTHLALRLDRGPGLRFIDPRRFGWLKLHAPDDPPRDTAHYGPDALDPTVDAAALARLLRRSRAPLKAFLLDQTKLAGLGNIYACEALWRAGLSPRRLARNTPRAKTPLLLEAIRGVLQDSLAAGGTSFNDYMDSIGREGAFLPHVAVFRRQDQPCPRCGAPIRRITQSGRSTFYCSPCQK